MHRKKQEQIYNTVSELVTLSSKILRTRYFHFLSPVSEMVEYFTIKQKKHKRRGKKQWKHLDAHYMLSSTV